jgi:hypothetical protein
MDVDKLSVEVVVVGGVLFVVEKNRGRIRNEGGRDNGCSSGHKLNIIDRLTDGFKSVSNFIYKNDLSL